MRSAKTTVILVLCTAFLWSITLTAQDGDRPGHSIGKVSTSGDLIVMELNEGALGKANLFDLAGHTLRFIPQHSRYYVESTSLRWDPDFGPALSSADVTLHNFSFPFSGKTWNSFQVGNTGWISFGDSQSPNEEGGRSRGVAIGRFEPLAEAAGRLFDSAPAICVFFKPRMSGTRYAKELADRVVVTWDLTEPFGNIQDFTWSKTTNRFQAVLKRDGEIDISYEKLAAKDAIVGLYPDVSGKERTVATIQADPHPDLAGHLDVRQLRVSVVDDVVLKATLETRGPVLQAGNPGLQHFAYQVSFQPQTSGSSATPNETVDWTIVAVKRPGRSSTYFVFGPASQKK